jgi:mannonate dehydratase
VARWVSEGVRHVRVQCGFYGASPLELRPETAGYGGAPGTAGSATQHRPDGALDGAYFDPRGYTRSSLAAIEAVRAHFGDGIELLHDVHERLRPAQAVEFAKELERYRLFFLEDLLAPEDIAWFANVRATCTTPLAMGELFVHPAEWTPLIVNRRIDFVRMHISAMGGLTPARKVAAMAEIQGIRTAWHGPGDVSPVGHAANLHLNLATPNFGIEEFPGFNDALREVFPGCPELRRGYLYPNPKPGWGVDLNEQAAARFPCQNIVDVWTQARLPDGSLARP